MAYRYRCGDCRFATRWTTESEVEDISVAHYADRHPGLLPGGHIEINSKNPHSPGFLLILGIGFLLLLIIASCRR
ncbi:hypothetical protein ACFW2Y_09090 [Streptomyces sp. NPDC058877]|uniref:hypothetical protein n=1 Tax=unclassified Streptomyces TaxID=2593676 RepID=UPI0036AAD07E